MVVIISVLQILLILLQLKTVESSENNYISLPGCQDSCGGIPIPYPFGISDNCSISRNFTVNCDTRNDDGKPTPYLRPANAHAEGASASFVIVNISVSLGQASINSPVSYQCYNTTTRGENTYFWEKSLHGQPFWLNNEKNKFVVTGCNTFACLAIDDFTNHSVGCLSTCESIDSQNKYGPSCSGIGCCQTAIPKATDYLFVTFNAAYNHSLMSNFSRCSYAMVVEDGGFQFNTSYTTSDQLIHQSMPAVFDWSVGDMTCKEAQTNKSSYACRSDHSVCSDYKNGWGYICNCSQGYQGNPYLQGGCQGLSF
jgi:Wall-associated receptor kinase galacturonan-binding